MKVVLASRNRGKLREIVPLLAGLGFDLVTVDEVAPDCELREDGATFEDNALAKARQAGYVGKDILGSGEDCDIWIHRGAGAYEAGEETALIESLEGKRAQPRLKPPFPAVVGLYGCPTVVNNVETICNVPLIIEKGHEWFAGIGPEKNTGPKLFCISGHVKKPGVFEACVGLTLRELHEQCVVHRDSALD